MKASVPKKADKFPLFKHPRGYWCKTILGKHKYFGKVADDPDGKQALKRWLREKEWRLAGLEPPTDSDDAITVKFLCNRYLESKEVELKAGHIVQSTFDELKAILRDFMEVIPGSTDVKMLTPQHFGKYLTSIAERHKAPTSIGKRVTKIKSVFKHAWENRLIETPVHFGTSFKRPPAKAYRKARNERGNRCLERAEVMTLLKSASKPEAAMILLGLNCGFGNTDCGELKKSDIKSGWIELARKKTGVTRRAPLWKETEEALNKAIAETDKEFPYVFANGSRKKISDRYYVTWLFTKLCERAKVEGRTFYDLRRSFQTRAENEAGTVDTAAIRCIMGHVASSSDMSSVYRQFVSDDRLRAVTDAVRKWLWPRKGGAK